MTQMQATKRAPNDWQHARTSGTHTFGTYVRVRYTYGYSVSDVVHDVSVVLVHMHKQRISFYLLEWFNQGTTRCISVHYVPL